MRNPLSTILSVFTTAVKRMSANVGLVACVLLALTAAVALSISIPVYAEGASLRLLRAELERAEQRNNRSAFALLFRYLASQAGNGPREWEQVRGADDLLVKDGLPTLQLPLDGLARHARTDQMRLFLPPSAATQNQFLKSVNLGFLSGMEGQIRLVDGEPPGPAGGVQQPVDVMISRKLADEIGINVGDRFRLVPGGARPTPIPIQVAGIWEPINPKDPAWLLAATSFDDVVLVNEATFTGPLAGALTREVNQYALFARLSGRQLTAAEAGPLLSRIEAVRAQAAGALPGLRLEQGPTDPLTRYRQTATALTNQLFVYSVPILALVFYFVALVASTLVNRQRSEIALLKTRGVRDAQILGIYAVEWLTLGAVAMLIGPWIGLAFATFMGRTVSFLQLSDDVPELPLTLTWDNITYGLIAVALAIAAALIPAFVATRRTLVNEQQQAARAIRPPFWQRFYLDVLLVIPPAYGIYTLRQGGSLPLGASSSTDPLSNPLLVLMPVFLCFALGLLAVRIIPLVLAALAYLAQRPAWTTPLVVLRTLSRQPGAYRGPLLLLMLTLSLATFSASMAATLDGALRQAVTYQVGAATQLIETGESTEVAGPQQPGGQPSQPQRRDIQEEPRFLFVPVSDHLSVDGITAAARVGVYDESSIRLGGASSRAQLVGIDRLDYPKVIARFDRSWSDGQPLGALMNLLARRPENVLVHRDVLSKGVKIGDALPLQVAISGDRREVVFRIVGAFDLWPGFYPQDGPIVVANLDYIFDQMGGQYPYDVWIARDPGADVDDLVSGVRRLGIAVVDTRDAAALITEEQAQPRRQGLFGLLSVGFIAAGALTLLGFLLSALITARRRAIELGVLRSIGLSGRQSTLALVTEQVVLVVLGVGTGTGIGLLASNLVVPLLQVGAGPYPGTPSYPPQIAWDEVTIIYLVFGATLLLTLLALAWVLGRMKLFQAVKLGDVN